MRLRVAAVPLILALVLTLAGCSPKSDPSAAPGPAATVVPPSPTQAPVAFGAWVQPTGGHGRQQQMDAVLKVEKELGHKLAIDHFFVYQLAPASTFEWRLKWDAEQGREPMITFGFGADTVKVAQGQDDTLLKSYAAAISESGAKLVLLRYAHEMDGAKNQTWVHSGPQYVAAWKHVHSLFVGLPVQWVWSPDAFAFGGDNSTVEAYYPGDDEVDWVAADGYNSYGCQGRTTWKPFSTIFAPFLSWAQQKQKPIMISEFGSTPDAKRPTRQAQWLADSVSAAQQHPNLRALVYYDSNGHGCHWALDSAADAASLGRLGTTAAINLTGTAARD